MKGLVLFLTYDRAKAVRAREFLSACLGRWRGLDWTVVEIDNQQCERPWEPAAAAAGRWFTVGGDNDCAEFSGLDRGWHESARRLGEDFDFILLTNDALLNSKPADQVERLEEELIRQAVSGGVAIGWIDTFARVSPRPLDTCLKPMRLLGRPLRRWLCSAFLILPLAVFRRVIPLAAVSDTAAIYGDFERPFRSGCGLSRNYQQFLLDHQARKWYRRYRLSAETFPTFKAKTRSIINEHLLAVRLLATGADWLDLGAAARERKANPTAPPDLRRLLVASTRQWRGEVKRSAIQYYKGLLGRPGQAQEDASEPTRGQTIKYPFGARSFDHAIESAHGRVVLLRSHGPAAILAVDRTRGDAAHPEPVAVGDVLFRLDVSGLNPDRHHSVSEVLSVVVEEIGSDHSLKMGLQFLGRKLVLHAGGEIELPGGLKLREGALADAAGRTLLGLSGGTVALAADTAIEQRLIHRPIDLHVTADGVIPNHGAFIRLLAGEDLVLEGLPTIATEQAAVGQTLILANASAGGRSIQLMSDTRRPGTRLHLKGESLTLWPSDLAQFIWDGEQWAQL